MLMRTDPAALPRRKPRSDSKPKEDKDAGRRERVNRFRSSGVRLDLKVSGAAARKLDSLRARCDASRNEFLEELLQLIGEMEDISVLRERIKARRAGHS